MGLGMDQLRRRNFAHKSGDRNTRTSYRESGYVTLRGVDGLRDAPDLRDAPGARLQLVEAEEELGLQRSRVKGGAKERLSITFPTPTRVEHNTRPMASVGNI